MTKKKTKASSIEELVNCMDFPHLRNEKGAWLQTWGGPDHKPGFSFKRLCFYGQQLRNLGMSDTDIILMFSDLYWDAVTEHHLNGSIKPGTISATECRRCGGEMKPGQALISTLVPGIPDFIWETRGVTLSPGGPGKLVDVSKCEKCGYSVTVGGRLIGD